ncbi:hypothetical protein UFOVP273_61 [uncultured Caudovirales phage]|uniref:Uncharacterized protein n=1 Tax=uncultured Caudovirales phage TaxID=2100421 RepID=A0A6J5LN80_9CAUD|nr:hypothetical protein UFOVP273_61 [uncultured Caudovirales phage]
MLKEYIAVLDEVPDHMVPVLVAHAVLGAHLHWFGQEDLGTNHYDDWVLNSFRKCVLRVNRKEFEKMRALPNVYEAHENTTLNGEKSCLVLCPRDEWPNVVKFAKLWSPQHG